VLGAVRDSGLEVFCVRFSSDSRFIAAGCGDGSVQVRASFQHCGRLVHLIGWISRCSTLLESCRT